MSNIKRNTNQSSPLSDHRQKSTTGKLASSRRRSRRRNVIVAVRVRPPFEHEISGETPEDVMAVFTHPTENKIVLMEPNKETYRRFYFDHVYGPEQTQMDVFRSVGLPVIEDVVDGVNGTMISYGQTGSGKTFTMGILGHFNDQEQQGLVPRSFQEVFHRLEMRKQSGECDEWECRISLLQIYMETIQDLLNPESGNLSIRESRESDSVSIPGLHYETVYNAQEANEVVLYGLHNRNIAPTLMNTTSSRAHTVLALEITVGSQQRTTISTLRLVDLAGSERVNRTQSSGSRLDEAKHINRSLSVLGHVISGLASNSSNTHIPYRDSKLTRILKGVLQGNSNTVLITTVSPALSSFSETLSTLLFAQRCMKVHVNPMVNERDTTDYKKLAAQLQEQIEALQSTDYIRQQQRDMLHKNQLQNASFSPKANRGQAGELDNEGIFSQLRRSHSAGFSSNASGYYDQDSSAANENDIEIMWGLVRALYDTLWELHEVSMSNLHESISRMYGMSNNWDENAEFRGDEPLMRDIFSDVDDRYPTQLLSNNSYSSMIDSFLLMDIEKRDPDQCDTIEEFIAEVAQLHRTIVGQMLCLSRFLEIRDLQTDEMKHELENKELDIAAQDQEIENMSGLLIRTLQTNTNLRKTISTRPFSRQYSETSGLSDTFLKTVDPISIAVQYNNAASIIQRAFRNWIGKKRGIVREEASPPLDRTGQLPRSLGHAVSKSTNHHFQSQQVLRPVHHLQSSSGSSTSFHPAAPCVDNDHSSREANGEAEEEFSQLDLYLKQEQGLQQRPFSPSSLSQLPPN